MGAALLLTACLSSPAADDPAPIDREPRAAGQVKSGGTMTVDRAAHSATLLDDGRVLVAGSDPTVEVFDPASGRSS